ncbi:MAG: hypothetical protein ACI4JY_11950 [Oscillospiraceae bacterium]
MQITEQRIAEIFDYSRFEPSKSMKEIISAFAEKYKIAQNSLREKVAFDELSGEKVGNPTKQPVRDGSAKKTEKKNGKSF